MTNSSKPVLAGRRPISVMELEYFYLHGVVPNVASPESDVANTIRYRRRKGTASMLEQWRGMSLAGWHGV